MIRLVLLLALSGTAAGGALLLPQSRALIPSAQAQTPAAQTPADSAARPVHASEIAELSDHLATLRDRLALAEARADSLARLVQHRQAEADSVRLEATDLARTLVRMDDAALAAVTRRLSARAFGQLYAAATARSQTRLLSALAPSQAAVFVRRNLGDDAPTAAAAPSATRAAPPADSTAARP